MSTAPVFANEFLPIWLFAITAIPFVALFIPGRGRIRRFFAFCVFAAGTAALSLALGFAIAEEPGVNGGFAQLCAFLVVSAPYALIARLSISRERKPSEAPVANEIEASLATPFIPYAAALISVASYLLLRIHCSALMNGIYPRESADFGMEIGFFLWIEGPAMVPLIWGSTSTVGARAANAFAAIAIAFIWVLATIYFWKLSGACHEITWAYIFGPAVLYVIAVVGVAASATIDRGARKSAARSLP